MLLLTFLFCLNLTAISCTSYCENFETCGTCSQNTLDNCVWCSAEIHFGKRCQSKDYHLKNESWCKIKIYEPKSKIENITIKEWSTGEHGGKIIQLKPQYVKIKASPGIPVDVTMSYKPAKDAPLEVYYVIENTNKTFWYLQTFEQEAATIFEALKRLTNNVRFGIGSFVEKPSLPYANPDVHPVCYSFKNQLSLTDNMTTFRHTLKNVQKGKNYDKPEALLDGLMQAMVCTKEIGWKNESRRIIIVSTGSTYHIAGDGKMARALIPNDMECHADGSMDTVLDYPSVSQINKVAMDSGYLIIFAINETVTEVFKLLSENIISAKYVALQNTFSISAMITNEYMKMLGKFEIIHNATSYIEIETKRNCTDCKATHFNPLELVTTFKVTSCPPPSKTKEYVKISPTSLNEAIIVEIEFDCKCDCEKIVNTEKDLEKCHNAGTYQCGICKCHASRYGENCECTGDSWDTTNDYEKCKKNGNDILYCSGHGTCRCGKCDSCNKGYSGQYCEFDDNACPRRGGLLCSGNGVCAMGKCNCYPKWTSFPNRPLDCGCSTEKHKCIAPHSTKMCSGNGQCVCGKCECDRTDNANNTCRGRFCDNCKEFAAKRCEELRDYAYCIFMKKTDCKDAYNQTNTEVVFANKAEINSPNRTEWYMANWCRVQTGDGDKVFVFKYYYRDATEPEEETNPILVLVVQTELEMPPPADIWVPVGSAIGGIILIGLLTLVVWKVLTDLYYEREYNRFERKAKEAGYDVTLNPWYEPPVVKYINPARRSN